MANDILPRAGLHRVPLVPAPAGKAPTARVLLCDGHEIYRAGLASVLDEESAFTVAGEAGDLATAHDLVDRLRPDIVVAASNLPDGDALPLVRHCSRIATKIVVVAQPGDEPGVIEMVDAGARGYLLRYRTARQMIDTLCSALEGELSVDSFVTAQLIDHVRDAGQPPMPLLDTAAPAGGMDQLTRRQREVARLVADGLSNGEIAERLCLSTATVKSHIRVVLRLLNARDRTQLAIRAQRLPHL